jgi:hypothetical protein
LVTLFNQEFNRAISRSARRKTTLSLFLFLFLPFPRVVLPVRGLKVDVRDAGVPFAARSHRPRAPFFRSTVLFVFRLRVHESSLQKGRHNRSITLLLLSRALRRHIACNYT